MDAGFAELWQPDATPPCRQRPEEILLAGRLITDQQLQDAVRKQHANPDLSVIDLLVASRSVDEVHAFEAVAAAAQVPFVRLAEASVERGLFELVPVEFLKSRRIVPIAREDDRIVVGMSDPTDIRLLDELGTKFRCRIKPVVVPPGDIVSVLGNLSESSLSQVDDIIKDISEDAVEVVEERNQEIADLRRVADESPVIRYVNYLISHAASQNASDIHIEPGEDCMYVRCRIDGVLFEQPTPPLSMHAAITSRLKIMSKLDIAERRLPQDGRIHVTVEGRRMDLRVSTMPTTHGEKCVIRILDNRSILRGLDSLGLDDHTRQSFEKQISQPHGIVLVTGPTGSGKSTTLYSALQTMDAVALNISTVEDPVEYYLPHVTQIHVNEAIGLTFPAVLRSLLRQDPDIIMVGEIRDPDTARIAVQASLTGHLVLSTLHTNDAPSSITRLVNIGIEPYLLSASVNAILAQRLVRRICKNCSRPTDHVTDRIRPFLDIRHAEVKQFYMGAGCAKCRNTGYKGRVGVYELLVLNEELRGLVARNPSLGELKRAAQAAGMRDLAQDGLAKLSEGLTTAEELLSIIDT